MWRRLFPLIQRRFQSLFQKKLREFYRKYEYVLNISLLDNNDEIFKNYHFPIRNHYHSEPRRSEIFISNKMSGGGFVQLSGYGSDLHKNFLTGMPTSYHNSKGFVINGFVINKHELVTTFFLNEEEIDNDIEESRLLKRVKVNKIEDINKADYSKVMADLKATIKHKKNEDI